tara:strand:+ start:1596 stop:1820 length:225 start_codon:yes stop_codon:yes gene_type:complete
MSVTMWVVGSIIFAVYMYFTVWNINNGHKKTKEPESSSYDVIDMDGMGNFSRFPTQERMKKLKRKKIKKRKVKL